ncbi:NDR1/HIN1-like protein 12 [Elaeis guineensis]|uniref:NDR1/HIN1-like protein 12 n=1 Tax=Elaeis guineensis var. tenera TaxID=51953 RepID=A0A8N4EYD6_ELAGV|nr:NDR1/HIN1-like protein 12 [Elaeis guineensis]
MTRPMLPSSPRRTSLWGWAAATVCAILAISVIITGIVVFAIYMIYKPKMPYIKVADAHLNALGYDQSGLLNIEMALTILAENDNFKAHASFSDASFNLRFHGIKIAVLQAAPFDVPKNSSFPIYYLVSSSSIPLDQGGMEAMDMALKQGIVPFRFDGQMRTRWKVGIFVSVRFWTHLTCELRFFWPSGTAMNPLSCTSKSH